MNNNAASLFTGNSLRGVAQIVRFNWTKYVLATVLGIIAVGAIWFGNLTFYFELAILAMVAVLVFWLVGSLVASHWIYDRSPLADWRWLPALFAEFSIQPSRWANLHAGFDETSVHLHRLLPASIGTVVDFFDPRLMTERSIQRARRSTVPEIAAQHGKPDALPFREARLDCVFLLFAAHEIRSPSLRVALFREVHRILIPAGKLILVEHMRDKWNWLAFGPGAFHFFSRREWLRVLREAGLVVRSEGRITPFVHYFVLERPQ